MLLPSNDVAEIPPQSLSVPNPTDPAGCRAWIVGLGTPNGDDRAGWEAVTCLQDVLPVGMRAAATSDPLAVLESGREADCLIVVDSCRGAGTPGSLHRFVWPSTQFTAEVGVSSHGVGLAAALELARLLGRLPPRVVVFVIEGHSVAPGAGLSRVVEAALSEVVTRVLAELGDDAGESPRS